MVASMSGTRALACAAVLTTVSANALGGLVTPYTEDFTAGPADWYDSAGTSVLDWEPSGGPMGAGDGYVTTSFAFADAGPFGAILFRGQDEFQSSDDRFVGKRAYSEADWEQ